MKKSTDLLQGKGENEEQEWITANGQHIPVGGKESKKEAVKKFVERQENKANNAQKEQGEQIDEREQNSENLPKIDKNKIPTDEETEDMKRVEIEKLTQALKSIKKIKLKELAQLIQSFDPIDLKIYDKKIAPAFDKYSANKNLYTRGNSTYRGFAFKLENIQKLPEFIKDAKYIYSKEEEGKESKQHKGVKEWHYFKKEIQIENEKYEMVVNIRDKGNQQYIYEVIFK